jgi:anti-sigma B factor antagonist
MRAIHLHVQRRAPRTAVVELEGDFTLETAHEVRKKLLRLCKRDVRELVVDFVRLSAVDTAGIAVLVEVLQSLGARGGKLKLAALDDKSRQVVRLTRLDQIFRIYDSVDAALESATRTEITSGALPGGK